MSISENFEKYYEDNKSRFVSEWMELLAIPSVSADSAYAEDCRNCANWLVSHLVSLGFKSELIETSGHPLVLASRSGRADKPHILFYGHYDVQPEDPKDKWLSDPFKPQIRDGRLYARGAVDNKGQVWFFIKAVEALLKANKLDCNLTLLIEGQEESGSTGLKAILPEIKDRLKSDILMVCDTGAQRDDVLCVTMGLRGLISMEIELTGPKSDLHSGIYGGAVQNPALQMARLLATLHASDGSIAVPGYYDGIATLSDQELALMKGSHLDEAAFLAEVGVPACGGETSYSIAERLGVRPCIDINGLYSGYSGFGSKTIIPAKACAKITSRIAAGQDPQRCLELLEAHFKAQAPKGLTLSITHKAVHGPALQVTADSPLIKKVRPILEKLSGGQNDFVWEGASVPILTSIIEATSAQPLLVGFSMAGDNLHAPNESFSLARFKRGYEYVVAVLSSL